MTGIPQPTHFIERNIAPVILDAMQSARAVALLGPRQAGKSTLARALAAGASMPADYLTLDDDPIRSAARADPDGFLAALGRRTVIDEVQRAPDLLLAVKARLDRDDRRGQFLLTGSANLRRIPTVADALPGRVDYLTLWPLTQGEIRGHQEQFLDGLFDQRVPTLTDAARTLRRPRQRRRDRWQDCEDSYRRAREAFPDPGSAPMAHESGQAPSQSAQALRR